MLYGLIPPVKINFEDLSLFIKVKPAKNLSGSFHSMIFEPFEDNLLPPPLNTTIASDSDTWSGVNRRQGFSIICHNF